MALLDTSRTEFDYINIISKGYVRPFITVVLASILFSGCSATLKTSDVSAPRIHNMAPDFIAYWNRVKAMPSGEKISFLKSDFFPKFPEFYRYKIQKWEKNGKMPDEELAKHLDEFHQLEAEFVQKTKEITSNLNSTMASFIKSVPGLNKDFDIYITHSFGEMDGGTRRIGDKIYFILGVDGMIKYHKDFSSEIPFFHHELFHVYHGQYLPEEDILWVALWAEGLATYVSEQLNPQASMKDLMLDLPEGMIGKIQANIDYHWMDLTEKLTSKNEVDYETYFLLSSKDKKIVKRAGYYLGYLLAKEIGRTRSVPQMAQMRSDEILPLLKATIGKIQKLKSKPNTKLRSY